MNMQLKNLIYQISIENVDKQSDERNKINMIDDKDYNERYKIGENKEETLNTDI